MSVRIAITSNVIAPSVHAYDDSEQARLQSKDIDVGRVIGSIIGMQMAITAVAAAIFYVFGSTLTATSAVAGGIIGFVPSATYGVIIGQNRATTVDKLLKKQYLGEGSKLLLTVLLFGIVFWAFDEVSILPLFITYVLTLLTYWAALLIFA